MNYLHRSLAMLGLALAAFCNAAHGQTGSISGRVHNEVTGQYLNNARVSVKGTGVTVFTDETGTYRISGVPAGNVVIEALYSGLDPQQVTLAVTAGQNVERDITLTNKARYGEKTDVVKLDPFVAATSKLTEGEALATNEQRFSANIKNVVATDAFGDVTEGNVAEFMKFLPGITVDYSDVMPQSIGVRGFDPNLTSVNMDGATMANAAGGGTSRGFAFTQVSINNISRIELTKVPTPANAADSMSGSINMVSKSAFERSRAQLNWRVFINASSDGMMLDRQPFPFDTMVRRIKPGFDLDYTLPITKNFGIVFTALSSKLWNEQNYSSNTWNGRDAGATPTNPFMQSHQVIDAPKWYDRDSASLKMDWRLSPNAVLSVGLQATYYQDMNGNVNRTVNVSTSAASTPAGGEPLSWSPTFTRSAAGRPTVTFAHNFLHIAARTLGNNVRYRFENSDWKIDSGVSFSTSKTWSRYHDRGTFNSMNITLLNPAGTRVFFEDITPVRPGTIRLIDAAGRDVNLNDPSIYQLNTATSPFRDARTDLVVGDLNVRRKLTLLEMPAGVQFGGQQKVEIRDNRRMTQVFTYNPPNPADRSPTEYVAQVYSHRKNYFDFDDIPWTATNRAVEAWKKNPSLFTQTLAQQVNQEIDRITNSQWFHENTTAIYGQADVRLFRNRLLLLTGVRYEKTHVKAAGPLNEPSDVFQRTPTGAFVRNAAGARIRRPEAGAAGSLEEVAITRTERGSHVNRDYDGYYPSVHLTYNATERLLIRAAYAKTYGRPDLNNAIPTATITENDLGLNPDPRAVRGTIAITNPALQPWTADNYDLSAEYYTDQGGVFSAGVFRKDITDFFGTRTGLATVEELESFDLGPEYEGWNVNTTINAGAARVSGIEFNLRQSLSILGEWGRMFSVFANASKLKLQGSSQASFSRFLPKSVNWGVTFTRRPFTVMAKWNHRGEQRQGAELTMGPDSFNYFAARTTLDVNVTYQATRRISMFVNGRNVGNVHYNTLRFGSQTPDYAKRASNRSYGVQWSFGVKGTF
jgi:iron complex outermembrane recepter protein